MNALRLPFLTVFGFFVGLSVAVAQNSQSFDSESALADIHPISPTSNSAFTSAKTYQFQKKLSRLYSGFAIEVISSDLPLQKNNPIFRQFGNIYYEKLREGGYSYLILADFSSKEAALDFVKNIIQPRASDAMLFEYKDGNRKAIRG